MSLVPLAQPAATSSRRPRWRLAAALLWLLAAVAVMYQLDRAEARRLDTLARDRQPTPAEARDMNTALALGQYLESAAAPPLNVLAAVTQLAPESVLLETFNYERTAAGGQLRITGQLGSVDDLDNLLNQLARSPLFHDVRPGPISRHERRWRFEISAGLRAASHYLAQPSPPADAPAETSDEPDEAEAPVEPGDEEVEPSDEPAIRAAQVPAERSRP